ncbi:hypothetical protein ACG2LH_07575 [Zhouia sp. PK063]|uniref:hypothetical protein n=1 Tax=Zhouia sp. PK063 TaxID=3373602 RepID=UPI0037B0C82F
MITADQLDMLGFFKKHVGLVTKATNSFKNVFSFHNNEIDMELVLLSNGTAVEYQTDEGGFTYEVYYERINQVINRLSEIETIAFIK